ncbi:amidohydrolase [Flaviaesturariibacter flavus]|uniref:Amidohydrolase n=1 Tax=Flaviaesturariibacter flavus TaxID=2502780 RepID=A0A4R1B550_9BACT|nr:amidohydrolase [Flaviaesturariibacter flavus]TCJ12610.1 amidohydrolase [Flaviaesturariibacter flavus]
MKRNLLTLLLAALGAAASGQTVNADLLVYNARIYTADEKFTVVSAMAIKDGKVLTLGDSKDLAARVKARAKLDARGAAIYPGLIDAHAHFVNYGFSLQRVNVVDTKSWEEVLQRVQAFARKNGVAKGAWIQGRGWDQNDWAVKEFPDRKRLDELFPDNPVILTRVDGHAAIVNSAALKAAGINGPRSLTGGTVEIRNGQPTGILVDNAVDLVNEVVPGPTRSAARQALLAAQKNCFAMGLTTVDDCGLDHEAVEFIDSLQKNGELKMRVYAMLSDAPKNFEWAFRRGHYKTDALNVRSFKVYADGALGSRGAALLHPYSDKPGWSGFLLSNPAHFDSVAALLYANKWQMCTHAIGDSGNRTILHIYGKYLKGKNDLRWRIEHAQVVAPEDFALFGKYSVVPSVQPTHATSDMYWAGDRLGPERVKGAYAYRQLLEQNGWIPLGTDFPVEDISPFKTFYAAVARRDAKGYPAGGYQMENALTRRQALWGMTLWAARANFEEREKGSLEPGKWADFVILDRDLLTVEEKKILATRVLATYVGGSAVFTRQR